jgi:hypothetical protein
MPIPLRNWLLCALVPVLAFTAALAPSLAHAVEPARTEKQVVEVKLWVVEVSQTKLRNLGFDWSVVDSGKTPLAADGQKFLGFLEALEQNNIAQIHARPQIATRSGQKATLDLSPHLKLEVTPTVTDAEHIDIAWHVDVATARDQQDNDQRRRLVSACSTELKSGAVQLLSETAVQRRNAKGELAQSKLLVLAQATVMKP